ncbi:MAG: ATP synthase F1 subunit gamma [Firmicutes bacterium]|nr:ATP synthase F1 subunit gamma [Bacillota bacterium]
MASLQDIRRRIRSVKNTQQVTKAMKMISAVKLRKSQDRLLAMRPYATKLQEVVADVVARFEPGAPIPESPLAQAFLAPREEQRIRVVVVASDKGLCGGFNANLLKLAEGFLQEKSDQVAHLDVVGKRVADWAKKTKRAVSREFVQVNLPDLLHVAQEIAESAVGQYEREEIDALYVIHNYFHSALSQGPRVVKVFPLKMGGEAHPSGISHLLEPSSDDVLASLLPRFVETELYRALVESAASEHAARMSSMDKASSNAQEMIDKLTLNMNKVRQAAITNQIIEIVSGAAS